METSNFIETYQTGEFDFCDKVVARLEDLLSKKDQDNLRHHFMQGHTDYGGVTKRKDSSFNFKAINDPLSIEMHSILGKYVEQYGEKHPSFLGKPCISDDMKVQKTTPKGGFHSWHSEHGIEDNASFRVLTWTLYLNDIPKGEGETEFLEYGVRVQPEKGALCLFPASWTHTHRGNAVYTCDKYIATGWYYLV